MLGFVQAASDVPISTFYAASPLSASFACEHVDADSCAHCASNGRQTPAQCYQMADCSSQSVVGNVVPDVVLLSVDVSNRDNFNCSRLTCAHQTASWAKTIEQSDKYIAFDKQPLCFSPNGISKRGVPFANTARLEEEVGII
eukprot:6201220-Pleurochrysis_carterae.AAC.2